MDQTESVLDLAVQLAREAGGIQRTRYETELTVDSKSTPNDLVTEVDRACEALIVERLNAERPGDSVVAEEGGGRERDGSEWCWIIDPLDGTTNFTHGYPRFCVSIGVERRGERRVAAVYDPLLDELYHAVRGGGAYCNGTRLRVSRRGQLGEALVATGFAYDRRGRQDNLAHMGSFLKACRALRRDGSAALDLCYVAAGRVDGYWELHLHPWDVTAGLLLVEEAGGRCSDLAGGPAPRSGAEVVASNGRIHEAMLALLGEPT